MPNELRELFALDPNLAYLNHGGFGAVPIEVLEERERWLRRIDSNPTSFYEWDAHATSARCAVSSAIHANSDDLAWMPNATFALNLIARSMMNLLEPGDEVLLTEHEYGAQVKLWEWVCKKTGATLRTAFVSRCKSEDRAAQILGAVTERTRVLQMSHITADMSLLLPVKEVCAALAKRDVITIVDGAHAPGHIKVEPSAIKCDYYVGDFHKWFVAPRGSAFLYASRENQARLEPLVIGWAGVDPQIALHEQTCRPGTFDVSAWMSTPKALEFHYKYLQPAVPAARARLKRATAALKDIGFKPLSCKADRDALMMATFDIPWDHSIDGYRGWLEAHNVIVGFTKDPEFGATLMRISVAWYTSDEDIDRLIDCLSAKIPREYDMYGRTYA